MAFLLFGSQSRFLVYVVTSFALVLSAHGLFAAPCGDLDASGQFDITDAVYLVNYIFAGGPAPQDDSQGDLDCNNQTDITDAVYTINYIFASGPAPCQGPNCGTGVLLVGEADSSAVSATYEYGPIGADSAEIIHDSGLLATRLECLLNPDATVGQVNAALNTIGGTITWMLPRQLSVTVAIPVVENKQEADSLGAVLVATGAFLMADAAFQIRPNSAAEIFELPPTGTAEIFHLRQMRMPAAWNVRSLIEDVNANVTVMNPDLYYRPIQHPEIASQVFISGAGGPEFVSTILGNHGFCTSGIIGANFDNTNTTGVHPGPTGNLEIRSMMVGGLTMAEILYHIAQNMPPGRFVLSTSIGFSTDLSGYSKAKRAIRGLEWRNFAKPRQSDFIHISSAGNEGTNADGSRYASLGSPFNVAAAFVSPFDLFDPSEIGPVDAIALTLFWNYYVNENPDNALVMNNLIVVGSSDVNGNESTFSCRGSYVRALGEGVAAPCVRNDPASVDGACSGTPDGLHIAYYDGTSFAAPQIAGLVAYLLSLDPQLDNDGIKSIIENAYTNSANPGFVDAYLAVLALDPDVGSAQIRTRLLDVANTSGVESPDGQFDEHDVMLLLAKFSEFEQLRSGVPNAPEDYARFDLNGDGFTGGAYATKFDLDINDPPQFSLLSTPIDAGFIDIDETSANDLDVLCYYAHSPLYTGSIAARDSLLVDCACTSGRNPQAQCGFWLMNTSFPDYLVNGGSAILSIRVGKLEGQDTLWQAGIGIQLTTTGGVPVAAQGTTDLNGFFNTSVSKDAQATSLNINISAFDDTLLVATGSETAWLKSAVVPTLHVGEICAIGVGCIFPSRMAPINENLVGSYLACEGYGDGVGVTGNVSVNSSLSIDQITGSLQEYQFSMSVSGSPTVEVVSDFGEHCYADGNAGGGVGVRFTVTTPIQFIYSPQTTTPTYPNSSQSFKLRQIGGSYLIYQYLPDPQNAIQDVSLLLQPGDYEMSASCGSCCGDTEYLSLTVQFAPPIVAGLDKAVGKSK